MSKIIKFSGESRQQLVKGINTLAKSVIATLGPNGRNVVIDKGMEGINSTKDGVSVAKSVELKDPIENLGAQMVKQAAIKTADIAGDGTTTSTLLASTMVNEGLKGLDSGRNSVQIKRGMDAAVKQVVDGIKKNLSEDISDEEQLKQIATVSANNDKEVGTLIATAFEKVGKEGVVSIEEGKSFDTNLEIVEGMQFERGYKSPYFVTDNSTMQCNLTDAWVLVYDGKLNNTKDILPLLERCSTENKALLVIAEDIGESVLSVLLINKTRGTLKCCAVKAPDFGERRTHLLEDIAVITGGTVISEQKGMKLKAFDLNWLGEARGINVDKDKTTIIDGNGEVEKIEARLTEIKDQIERAETPFARENLQQRLAKMGGGVAVINVGGYTETEMREKKDRVEDAMHATRAAIDEGIVPGGGKALLFGRQYIKFDKKDHEDFNHGKQIIFNALSKPFTQILKNAGMEESESNSILFSLDQRKNNWDGFNLDTSKFEDFKQKGIIDPFKVTRIALENACSVSSTILLTECTIVNDPEDKKEDDVMSQMAGMMG